MYRHVRDSVGQERIPPDMAEKNFFEKKACIRQAFGVMSSLATGCGSVWLERSVRDAEAARSNRAIPTIKNRRVPVKLEPVFFMLQAVCVPCLVLPVPVRGEGESASQPKGGQFF